MPDRLLEAVTQALPVDDVALAAGQPVYELVRSFVDAPLPESDLFAGVREALATMEA